MRNEYASIPPADIDELLNWVEPYPQLNQEVPQAVETVRLLEGRVDMMSLICYRDAANCLCMTAREGGFVFLAETFYSWYVHASRVLLAYV